ncbi:hypothetical protein K435DRAFT_621443, partial [Dendrothele bispora CBS 962.96]
FGVVKRQWKIVRELSEYSLKTQSLIPLAIAVLHNIILVYDPPEGPAQLPDVRDLLAPNDKGDVVPSAGISNAESACALERRDKIAEEMWQDYIQELDRRG